jgi:hypothetical protein
MASDMCIDHSNNGGVNQFIGQWPCNSVKDQGWIFKITPKPEGLPFLNKDVQIINYSNSLCLSFVKLDENAVEAKCTENINSGKLNE